MNLFVLDYQPDAAARYNNDWHVRKIILEAVEMMAFAYGKGGFKPLPYSIKSRFYNHPMAQWVRQSRQNFDWTLQHAQALSEEFTHRWGRIHAYQRHIDWISFNLPLNNLPDTGKTDWPRCFGYWKEKVGVTDDAIYDYRRYYMIGKKDLAKWTKRPQPEWFFFNENIC